MELTSSHSFESFVADLAAFAAPGPEPLPLATALPLDPQAGRLAARVRGELMAVSVMTAVACGLANALERQFANVDPRALAVYCPMHTAMFATAVDRLIDTDLDGGLGDALQSYGARLALAQRMSAAIVGGGAPGRSAHVDPEILADAWRRVATGAIALIEALTQPETSGAAGGALAPLSPLPVLNLLRMAESGECPCLDADGRITIPGWAERRREPRTSLQLAASALIAGRLANVIVRDASPSGLGLVCAAGAGPGDRIVVRLAGGREIAGLVAWADGVRIGVRLDARLDAADPLLAGG